MGYGATQTPQGLVARLVQSPGFWTALAMHFAVVAALLSHAPVRQALSEASPLMVSLLPSPPVAKPTELPKPKPVTTLTPRPVTPQPVLAAPQTAAPQATWVTPAVEPRPLEPIATAAPPSPTPAAIAPPRFDADYLNNPPPRYPAVSRRLGEQGRVVMRVLVSAAGLPQEVRLHNSSGFERLDTAALETVKQWKFVAARQGETTVAAWVLVPISFSIKG